ncbi:MAG: transporter substrate-binding domain-containing protein [Verrucomicrobiota bacterium]
MRRRIIGALLLGALLSGCSREPSNALVVGMELTYPPFETRDTQGEPFGVSIDLAEALAADLGRPLVIRDMAFDGLIPALQSGKIDIILSSMTKNVKREQSIDFSDPYVSTGLSILVPKDSPVQSIDDIDKAGQKLVVKIGTTGDIYATDHLRNPEIIRHDYAVACVEEVAAGKADAFIYDQLSIYENWKERQEKTRAILEPFQMEVWAVGIKKGNEGMKSAVNAFLTKFREEGGFEKLAEKHLKEQQAAFAEMGTSFIF